MYNYQMYNVHTQNRATYPRFFSPSPICNLLFCSFAGMSRSASIIIAYLMKSERMTFDEAFRDVKSKKQDVW